MKKLAATLSIFLFTIGTSAAACSAMPNPFAEKQPICNMPNPFAEEQPICEMENPVVDLREIRWMGPTPVPIEKLVNIVP